MPQRYGALLQIIEISTVATTGFWPTEQVSGQQNRFLANRTGFRPIERVSGQQNRFFANRAGFWPTEQVSGQQNKFLANRTSYWPTEQFLANRKTPVFLGECRECRNENWQGGGGLDSGNKIAWIQKAGKFVNDEFSGGSMC